MFPGSYVRVYRLMAFTFLIGAVGHLFFFQVQENFYGQENNLKFLYDILGSFQLSMTSYFGIFSSIGSYTFCLLMLFKEKHFETGKGTLMLYGVPVVIFGLYAIREWRQSINPPYPDNFLLDVIMAAVACLTQISIIAWASRPTR